MIELVVTASKKINDLPYTTSKVIAESAEASRHGSTQYRLEVIFLTLAAAIRSKLEAVTEVLSLKKFRLIS